MISQTYSLFSKRLKAFSLIELGIVLLIVGIIMGAVFKGQDLLQSAKINSVLDDIRRYKNAVLMYQHTYGEWPGDDPKASVHFANAKNGDGDGIISGNDEPLVWNHLAFAESLSHGNAPASKLGGKYRVTSDPSNDLHGTYLMLGQGDGAKGGLFTPKQAQHLKKKADDGKANEGMIRFIEGENANSGDCIKSDAFNVSHDKPVCVMAVHIQ